jgi:hypothetical protein
VITRGITISIEQTRVPRPNTEWYSDELRAAKRDRRKAERRMHKSNLTVHREMFRDTCLKTNTEQDGTAVTI